MDRSLIRRFVPTSLRQPLKRILRRIRTFGPSSGMTLDEIEAVLSSRLGITRNDTVMVHASFGSLRARFEPKDLIDLLQAIVGDRGNIMMPCYPSAYSHEWLTRDKVFDVRDTPSVMGVLSNEFRKVHGTVVSVHPIKSVAAWGPDSEWLVAEHQRSRTPFDAHSPYYRSLSLPNAKSIGLGVEVISFYHCCEDLQAPDAIAAFYDLKTYVGRVRTADRAIVEVPTCCHDAVKVGRHGSRCKLLEQSGCPGYTAWRTKGVRFYSVPHRNVFEHYARLHRMEAKAPPSYRQA